MKIGGKTLSQHAFTTKDQIKFLKQWQRSIDYGTTTMQFCESLIENGRTATKLIGKAGLDAPGKQQQFSDALQGWFPKLIVSSLGIAITQGDTRSGIDAAIRQLEGGERIISQLAKILTLPYIIIIATGLIGIYVSGEILAVSSNTNGLGTATRQVIIDWGWLAAMFAPVLLALLSGLLPYWRGSTRTFTNNWPIFAIYRTATAATLLSTLANLLACNMKLNDALESLKNHCPPFLRWHIEQILEKRIGQSNLGYILDTGLLLPTELAPLRVLGNDVDYSQLMMLSASSHQEHVETRIKLIKAIAPKAAIFFAIVQLGALLGTAMFQSFNAISISI